VFPRRVAAYMIDMSIISLLLWIIVSHIAEPIPKGGGYRMKGLSGLLLTFMVVFSYYTIQEYYFHQTIGKTYLD
jgi:uncharacterized RDD family membrane protein YckC